MLAQEGVSSEIGRLGPAGCAAMGAPCILIPTAAAKHGIDRNIHRAAGRAEVCIPLAVPAEEARVSIKEGEPVEQVRENEGRDGKG